MKKVLKFIDGIDGAVGPVILLVMFIDVVLGVVTRLMPGNPLSFSVELGEILLSFMIWLSLSRGVKEGLHINFDLVIKKTPPMVHKIFDMIGTFMFITFLVILSFFTIEILNQYLMYESKTTIMRINKFWIRLPILIGCIASIVRLLVKEYEIIKTDYTKKRNERALEV